MVLHLSTFHMEGGAGVAATRLHHALLKAGTTSAMLVPVTTRSETGVTGIAGTAFKKKIAWARFVAERLYFYPHEKDASVRFAFSPAWAGTDISRHPLVQQADILHLHWINFGFLSLDSLDSLFALGKPVVWTLHDMWAVTGGCHYSRGCTHFRSHCHDCPFLASPDTYDISFAQFERKRTIYSKTKLAMVSPSQWLHKLVRQAALTSDTFSTSIPNCIDTEVFAPGDGNAARKQLGLPDDRKLILFAGANTSDKRKGFTFFEEAMRQLHNTNPKIEALVLGKANPAAFEGFPTQVHYLGKITETAEMVRAYQAADLIVVPSLEDNLPNTIMEAMSCGTPVVGFRTGGIPEMVDHKLNGYIADFESPESLASGISWVLANNEQRQISGSAREKVLLSYREDVVASQYNRIYESLLSE